MDDLLIGQIRELISGSEKILVTTHVRPDGDAIGLMLGLGLSLLAVGKEVQMVLNDAVPVSLRHLEGSKQIAREIKGAYDFSISLEVRISRELALPFQAIDYQT